jgi:hypothetical protein
VAEAAAFFAQSFKADSSPKAPSPFAVLASAAIKGPDQKIFRHHDSSLAAEDVILLFDLLAGSYWWLVEISIFTFCFLISSILTPAIAEKCPGLETLDLENNKLNAESAYAIAAGLQKLPSLRRLDLVSGRAFDLHLTVQREALTSASFCVVVTHALEISFGLSFATILEVWRLPKFISNLPISRHSHLPSG